MPGKTSTMIRNYCYRLIGTDSELQTLAEEANKRRQAGEDMGPPPKPTPFARLMRKRQWAPNSFSDGDLKQPGEIDPAEGDDPEARDDGTYVPIWKHEATDERGRKRLHGASTEGFSAGYFDTVGSKEAWTPTTLVSSRASGTKGGEQQQGLRPDDFTSEDDLTEQAESQKLGLQSLALQYRLAELNNTLALSSTAAKEQWKASIERALALTLDTARVAEVEKLLRQEDIETAHSRPGHLLLDMFLAEASDPATRVDDGPGQQQTAEVAEVVRTETDMHEDIPANSDDAGAQVSIDDPGTQLTLHEIPE
ncbi:hypothetical protein LTR65_003333 [Meristemomyces frigidus]